MNEITSNSIVEFALSVQAKDKNSYYIGNKNSGVFIEVPTEAVNILSYFDGKTSISEISDFYVKTFGEELDLLDFIELLHSLNLIYKLDGKVIGSDNLVTYNKFIFNLSKCVFNKISLIIYFALFFISFLYLFVFYREYFPSYKDSVLFDQYKGISLLIFILTSWLITIFHELGHYFAAVKLNIQTSYKLTLRFFMLVVEADINGIWAVSKNQRYICYFAGVFFETILLFISVLLKPLFADSIICSIFNLHHFTRFQFKRQLVYES